MRRLVLACAAACLLGAAPAAAQLPNCDDLDPAVCLQPWPNNHFTKADASTDTGRRLNLSILDMPRNVAGKPIDPTAFNRNDGFSPGSLITTFVPGLDLVASGAVPITDVKRSFSKKAPIVVIDATTLKRHLIWSEMDVNAAPENRNLHIRPAVNFKEGRTYIVALRNLKDADGDTIPAGAAFRAYRDGSASGARAERMEWMFKKLAKAGIERRSLFLAWDFTVASKRNLSERMLHIRDDAFAQLGDTNLADMKVEGESPRWLVTGTEDFAPCGTDGCQEGEDDRMIRRIEGRVLVPCYLDVPGCPPGSQFAYLPGSDVPQAIPGNTMAASFVCFIPRWAVDGGEVRPTRPSLYGHGLLGTASQVTGGAIKALGNEHGFTMCATDWAGMSTEDVPNAVTILNDVGRMATLADRGQQGMLNFLYLGRAMIHPRGLNTDPAFQVGGRPVIDTQRLYYVGGSQGGIMGGSLTAVAPDFNRAALGVPAMNYSTLLRRSIDFDQYAVVLNTSYPNEIERPFIYSLIQNLWDRAEANGYAWHMTRDPYANTPPHEVILNMAYGDHQVTNWATAVEARTIGARIRQPALDPGRSNEVRPFYGIPSIESFPFGGSLFEVWDVGPLRTLPDGRVKGTNPPPPEEIPNREGVDPHGPDASEQPTGRAQVSNFLQPDGLSRIIDVCGASPCYLDGWTGP